MPIKFATLGDTVLGIGMESIEHPDVALARGQGLESYHTDERTTESLKNVSTMPSSPITAAIIKLEGRTTSEVTLREFNAFCHCYTNM